MENIWQIIFIEKSFLTSGRYLKYLDLINQEKQSECSVLSIRFSKRINFQYALGNTTTCRVQSILISQRMYDNH